MPTNDLFVVADLHDGKYLLSVRESRAQVRPLTDRKVMQNLLALRERQKVEAKLRDAIAQRKARRLAIDGKYCLHCNHHYYTHPLARRTAVPCAAMCSDPMRRRGHVARCHG